MRAVMGLARRRAWLVGALTLTALHLVPDIPGGRAEPRTAPAAAAQIGGACTQSAYATHGTRQDHPFVWVLNVSSVPAYLDRAATVRAIRQATDTVAHARTPCHTPRRLAPRMPRAFYDGLTRRHANITPGAACVVPSNSDGINVVSFGPLPHGVVAVTCTYVDRREIWQSDIMFNDQPGLFTLHPDDGHCLHRYDLQGVATHERGHSFGLAHVTESSDSDELTMSSVLDTCDASARTLGRGDVAGLSRIY